MSFIHRWRWAHKADTNSPKMFFVHQLSTIKNETILDSKHNLLLLFSLFINQTLNLFSAKNEKVLARLVSDKID